MSLRLYGDGIHDDTAAIQARLDNGDSLIYLPPPVKYYTISKTLLLHSGQELRLDRFSVIRLAPQSNCCMLSNDNHEEATATLPSPAGYGITTIGNRLLITF